MVRTLAVELRQVAGELRQLAGTTTTNGWVNYDDKKDDNIGWASWDDKKDDKVGGDNHDKDNSGGWVTTGSWDNTTGGRETDKADSKANNAKGENADQPGKEGDTKEDTKSWSDNWDKTAWEASGWINYADENKTVNAGQKEDTKQKVPKRATWEEDWEGFLKKRGALNDPANDNNPAKNPDDERRTRQGPRAQTGTRPQAEVEDVII